MEDPGKTVSQFWIRAFAYFTAFYIALGNAFGLISVQILHGFVPQFELNAWRFGCHFLFAFPFVIKSKCALKMPGKKIVAMITAAILVNVINVLVK